MPPVGGSQGRAGPLAAALPTPSPDEAHGHVDFHGVEVRAVVCAAVHLRRGDADRALAVPGLTVDPAVAHRRT